MRLWDSNGRSERTFGRWVKVSFRPGSAVIRIEIDGSSPAGEIGLALAQPVSVTERRAERIGLSTAAWLDELNGKGSL